MSLTQAPGGTEVPDVTVVMPCYNERDHVELEIKRIKAALEAAGLSVRYRALARDLPETTPHVTSRRPTSNPQLHL